MTTATFILVLIGTVTGCLLLVIRWLAYQRDSAKLRLEMSREHQASEPFFKWLGGGCNYASAINRLDVYREFTNEGGPVTDLTIKADNDVQSAIIPKDHLGEHGKGKIELSKPEVTVLPPTTFEIQYTTRLGKRSKKQFDWPPNGGPMNTWPTQPLEPTPVDRFGCALAVDITGPTWLNSCR